MSIRGLLLPALAVVIGAGVGVAMILYKVTDYSVIFQTMSMGLSVAIVIKQNAPASDRMERKSWKAVIGMCEGYDEGAKEHSEQEVLTVIKDWIKARDDAGLPKLAAIASFKWVIYPVRNNGEDSRVIAEYSAVVEGEMSPKYDANRSNAEIKNTIEDLARTFLTKFNQKRVYYSFLDVQYTIDA